MADETTINIGGQAAFEKKEEAPYSSDTTKSLSPEQKANAAQSEALATDEIAGTKAKADNATQVAQIEADNAAQKEGIGTAIRAERARVDEQQAAIVAQRAEELRRVNDEIKATPTPSLFADASGWSKVTRALGLAVAGWGDALAARASARLGQAHQASAAEAIIRADIDRQERNIMRLKDNQLIAKEGVKDAQQAREQALARVDLKGAQMYAAAADHLETLLKAKKVAEPAIAQNEEILKLRRAEQDRKDKLAAGLTAEHTRVGAKTETTNRTIPDTNTGKGNIGIVKNADGSDAGPAAAAAAEAVNKETTLRLAAVRGLNKFLQVAQETGGRAMIPGTDDYNKLVAAHADAVAAITSVTNMPGTDRSSLVEAERLGPTGKGPWHVNPQLVRDLAESIKKQGEDRIRLTANSVAQTTKGGEARRPTMTEAPPVTGAPAPTTPSTQPMVPQTTAPAKPLPPRRPNDSFTTEQKEAVKWIAAHPDDPRVPDIKKRLGL